MECGKLSSYLSIEQSSRCECRKSNMQPLHLISSSPTHSSILPCRSSDTFHRYLLFLNCWKTCFPKKLLTSMPYLKPMPKPYRTRLLTVWQPIQVKVNCSMTSTKIYNRFPNWLTEDYIRRDKMKHQRALISRLRPMTNFSKFTRQMDRSSQPLLCFAVSS